MINSQFSIPKTQFHVVFYYKLHIITKEPIPKKQLIAIGGHYK